MLVPDYIVHARKKTICTLQNMYIPAFCDFARSDHLFLNTTFPQYAGVWLRCSSGTDPAH